MSTHVTQSDKPAEERDLDRPVALHALTFLEEGDEVTVGRSDIDSYCVLPADGAALLRELTRGMTPNDAASWYHENYHQVVDMTDFLSAMEELGFVAVGEAPSAVAAVRWQRLGRAMFSPVAWLAYATLLIAALVSMVRHPDLLPRYSHLFFTPYLTIVILTVFFGQVPFALFHELFHMIAGRRLGIRSRLNVGRRLYFVVFETSLDGLVMVPRRKRYLPILAGMLADLLVISILTLTADLTRYADGSESLTGRICLALAFATLLRFVWQFYFYLQTDLYYAIVTALGCVDLQRTARRMVANRVNRLLGRRHRLVDESTWHPVDRAVARWYSWLLVSGYGFSLGTLLIVGVPTILRIARTVVDRLAGGASFAQVADLVTFLLVIAIQFAIWGLVVVRQRANRRPAASHVID